MGESQAAFGKCIDPRGFKFCGAIATQVTVAKVICIDDDDVGYFLRSAYLAEEKDDAANQ
jgi:hypothetical protein